MKTQTLLLTTTALFFAQVSLAQECNLANLDPIALDKNQNGVINRDEAKGTSLTWVFETVDRDGNGLITQPEFAKRCETSDGDKVAKKSDSKKDNDDSVVAKKASRQVDRQTNKAENRVDKETDKVVDKTIDKGLDRLFKR